MQFVIKSVEIENVVKGRSRYSVAHVTYDDRGQEKTRKIFSFSNPDVYATVQKLVGQSVEVTIGKNDAGYDEWKSVSTAASAPTPVAASGAAGVVRASGSNYETREERANRQVLIVKQSSLSAAVASLAPGAKGALDPKTVLDRAQEYTDWVFSQDDGSIESMKDDLDVLN